MGMKLPPEIERKVLELAGPQYCAASELLPAGITEREFMADVIALARRNGWRVYHTTDSRKSAAGFPDLVMTRLGRLIFAELKTETGKETQHQAEWRNDLLAAGSIACLWRPSDWPRIVEALTA